LKRIRIAKPWITDLEIKYVEDAIRNGWGSKCNDYIIKLEKTFAEYIGVKYAVATSSCTGAIHMALLAMGIGEGDEVIIPEATWISCAAAVIYTGAKPVFVDIKEDTWCIDPDRVESAITPRTKAIMPVHVYGNVAEMNEINVIATKHKLKVIEDAAEALGANYYNKKVGSIGDCGVFSFHGTKLVTAGEGGMFVTNDYNIYKQFCVLHNQGQVPEETKMFFPHQIGYKYKISNLQASLALAQIERVDELLLKKKQIFNWYIEVFNDIDWIKMNLEQPYANCSFWMPNVVFDKSVSITRDGLMEYLNDRGIDSRPFFYPLSELPMFEPVLNNNISYDISKRGINLPGAYNVTRDNVVTIGNIIKQYILS